MNILLTDLNSLTLDLPEMPSPPPEADGSFTHLLRQELAHDVKNGGQVAEFAEFFVNLPVPREISADAPKAAMETWRDYLSQRQISVTTNAEAIPLAPLGSAAETELEVQIPLRNSASAEPVAGELLPNGGNSLPPAASIEADLLLRPAAPEQAGIETRAVPGGISQNPVAKPDGAIKIGPNAVVEAAVPAAAAVETRSAAAVAAASAAFEDKASTKPLPPLPARMAPVQQAFPGESDAAVTRVEQALPLHPGAGETPRPRLLSQAVAATETAPRLPVAASMNQTTAPVAEIELPALHESSAKAEYRVLESSLARIPPVPRGAVAVDAVKPDQPAEIPPLMQQAAKPAVEAAAGVNEPLARAAEVFNANGGSQPQSAPAVSQAVPSAAVLNPSATATPAPAPLPPHLESMTLARNAAPAALGEGLGERVGWMVNQKQNSAIIRLDPPLLGKLDVQVRLADDATTITIQTQHAQTRDMIETASARLRDYLQESGFQNVNVDVSQRQDQQQARAQVAADEQAGEQPDSLTDEESESNATQHGFYSTGDGLVDTFA